MTTNRISNSDDVIDSRDVIARIEELTAERDELAEAIQTAFEELTVATTGTPPDAETLAALQTALGDARNALADWNEADGDELHTLEALATEGESAAADWSYGETLIRESYFVEYCQELCEDIGDLPKGIPSYFVIDWDATARNLRMDYTEIDFGGVAYLIR